MSNFLYNGVELPGLPETWNEAAHPHLFIRVVSLDGSAENAVYSLFAASAAAVSYDDNGILFPSSAVGEKYAVSDGAWVESSESLSDAFYIKRNDGFLYTLWANFDILNSDGSVYIAASEPVPVVEKFPIREWIGWLLAGLCSRAVPVVETREPVTYLEYIQLDGTQYVDTGIICDQNTKIEMTFTREEDDARYLFGVASSDNKASFTGYQSGVNSGSWRFGGAYGRPSVPTDQKNTFTMDKTGIVMNGKNSSYSGTVGTFKTPQTLVLGGCNSASGSVGSVRHIGKLYGFKLWDGDTLVIDYTPASNSAGVHGFENKVTGEFLPLVT